MHLIVVLLDETRKVTGDLTIGRPIHVLQSLALENFVIQLAPGLLDQIVECNASLLQRIFIKLVCKAIGIALESVTVCTKPETSVGRLFDSIALEAVFRSILSDTARITC